MYSIHSDGKLFSEVPIPKDNKHKLTSKCRSRPILSKTKFDSVHCASHKTGMDGEKSCPLVLQALREAFTVASKHSR